MRLYKHTVSLDRNRKYEIAVGSEILGEAGFYFRQVIPSRSLFILTHPRIAKLYLAPFLSGLKKAAFTDIRVFMMPEGERNKSLEMYGKVMKALLSFNREGIKEIAMTVLGGGVAGDIGAFAASTFKRGIDCIQVPTSLIAMCDSSIGGKTGIDFGGAKNMLGSFHQPRLVFADVKLLKTLSGAEYISGLAEVIKYAVIDDAAFFDYIERNRERILSRDPAVLTLVIKTCASLKAKLVMKDEFDRNGARAFLNYGHTIGHALEAVSGYRLKHGEAVSLGMVCANRISSRLGLLSFCDERKIDELLASVSLPVNMPELPAKYDDILRIMTLDKKFISGKTRFVLPLKIGRAKLVSGITPEDITCALNKLTEGGIKK